MVSVLIVVMYVDNNGLRTKSKELVTWFDDSLKKEGDIEMVTVGKFEWFLGVRYTYDQSTGSVQTDQDPTIDRLLEKYDLTNCNQVNCGSSTTVLLDKRLSEYFSACVQRSIVILYKTIFII
jgi:hypothetical protein